MALGHTRNYHGTSLEMIEETLVFLNMLMLRTSATSGICQLSSEEKRSHSLVALERRKMNHSQGRLDNA